MRRILMALVLAAALGGVAGGTAQAMPGHCSGGVTSFGYGVGATVRVPDDIALCLYTAPDKGYEVHINGGAFAGTSTGKPAYAFLLAGAGPTVCQYDPTPADRDNYTCAYAGSSFGMTVVPSDAGTIHLDPMVCTDTDEAEAPYCLSVWIGAGYDVSGKWVSVTAFRCEQLYTGSFKCDPIVGHYENFTDVLNRTT